MGSAGPAAPVPVCFRSLRCLRAIEVTKHYKFIGFGAIDVTKPYKFIRLGAIDVTKPYKHIGFGAGVGRVPG